MTSTVQRHTGGQNQSCGNCAYLRLGDDHWFECHRREPQISIRRECDDEAIKPVTLWPRVSKQHWCGEFARNRRER